MYYSVNLNLIVIKKKMKDLFEGREPANKRPAESMDSTPPEEVLSMHNIKVLVSQLLDPVMEQLGKLDSIEALQTDSLERLSKVEDASVDVPLLKEAIAEKDRKIDQLSIENKRLNEKLLSMESQQRRNNLQFIGMNEQRDEDCESRVLQLLQTVGLEFNDRTIERAHRLGKFSAHRVRPIIVRFHHFKDREAAFKKKSDLKSQQRVNIIEDFPEEIASRRRQLYPIVEAAYSYRDPQNPNFRYKARIVVDRLIVNGSVYGVNTLDRLPEALKPGNISTPANQETVVFYSKASPLSNHYSSKFVHEGITFNCVEQYLMYKKAKLFKDNTTADKVMQASDPVAQKGLGRDITGYEDKKWKEDAPKILEEGLEAKFSQDKYCKDFLLNTGDKNIGEASEDKFWGIGLKLRDSHVFDESKWGKNVMGVALKKVRELIS